MFLSQVHLPISRNLTSSFPTASHICRLGNANSTCQSKHIPNSMLFCPRCTVGYDGALRCVCIAWVLFILPLVLMIALVPGVRFCVRAQWVLSHSLFTYSVMDSVARSLSQPASTLRYRYSDRLTHPELSDSRRHLLLAEKKCERSVFELTSSRADASLSFCGSRNQKKNKIEREYLEHEVAQIYQSNALSHPPLGLRSTRNNYN